MKFLSFLPLLFPLVLSASVIETKAKSSLENFFDQTPESVIRDTLYDALAVAHHKQEQKACAPEYDPPFPTETSPSASKLQKIPYNALMHIYDFLDYDNILNCSCVSKSIHENIYSAIVTRLKRFNIAFVFSNYQLNRIFAYMIFKKLSVLSLSDPTIFNAFYLVYFKNIQNIVELSLIPRPVYQLILMFLYESIYGFDSIMPRDMSTLFSSISYQNGLDLTKPCTEVIKCITQSPLLNLTRMGLYSKMIKSEQYRLDEVASYDESIIVSIINSSSSDYLRILLEESTTPINFFHIAQNTLTAPVFISDVEKLKLIINYFTKQTDDPMPLLLVSSGYFLFDEEDFVHLMRDEFDLNKTYLIDINPTDLYLFGHPVKMLPPYFGFTEGNTFSFKQLVNLLEMAGFKLKHLFTSDINIFDQLPDQNNENVIPISKFIFNGILEPLPLPITENQ